MTTAERIKTAVPESGVVFLQRPGYSSRLGVSEGVAKPRDDDYTKENLVHMTAAAAALREAYKASRVVWVGHSGGAAFGALVMGTKAGLVDAAVLVGCPCGIVRDWRTHRNYSRGEPSASTWPASLSPIEHQDALARDAEVVLLTGDKDDNTLPRFAAAWVDKAKAKGVRAQLALLPGFDHGRSAAAPDVAEHAARLLQAP
jgi:pimeloyl-ACP methyl ester carboxylesterase